MSGGGNKKQKPSAQEKALAKDAARRWNDYVDRYVPVENEFMRRLAVTPDMVAGATSQAHADARVSQAGLSEQLHSGLAAQGAAPGTGRAVMAHDALERGTLEASGLAGANMVQGLYDRELAGKTKMSAFGRGMQDATSLSLAQAGQRATTAGSQALARRVDNRANALGAVVGVGALGYGLRDGMRPTTVSTTVDGTTTTRRW